VTGGSKAGQANSITLGEVVRLALPDFSDRLPAHHWKVLRAISACQTAALGGHQYRCAQCGKDHFVPHSCGNRHCPSCRKLTRAQWLEQQTEHLLPIPYFHVVFTLPHDLNPLIRYNRQQLYQLLFASASATLLEFGRNNLGATLGILAVLHTWSQTLLDHYHLHCVVTGGGLSLDGHRWVGTGPKWLFAVQALSTVFRAKFRDGLKSLFRNNQLQFPTTGPPLRDPAALASWLEAICQKGWVVYTKRPFAGPEAVLAYLCRYTHRVAITNSRIEALDRPARTVSFRYKDYADGARQRSMTLPLDQFLRRFCWHILPPHFVKIRSYGLLSNRNRSERIEQVRALLGHSAEALQLPLQKAFELQHVSPPPPRTCPYCGRQSLVLIRIIQRPRAPSINDTS
jgi:hypothetical protein